MSATTHVKRQHPGGVQQDWIAWLPSDTALAFEDIRQQLTAACLVLGVIVNDALSNSDGGAIETSPQLALLFVCLFDRLVRQLFLILDALEEHERAWEMSPNAVPLRPEYFRSRQARHLARAARLRSFMSLTDRSAFRPKLGMIRKVIASLQSQAHQAAKKIAGGESAHARDRWAHLEMLQYDLNTCLQETTIALKSFFCVLPGGELSLFRNRLPM